MYKVTLLVAALAIIAGVSSFGLCPRWSKLIEYKLWKENVGKLNLTSNECVLFRGNGHDSKVVCYDINKEDFLECPAHFMFDGLDEHKFEAFALGLNLNQTTKSEENPLAAWSNTTNVDLFDLYPRMHFGNVHVDSTISLHGKSVRLSLFHAHDVSCRGVHIIDAGCYDRLVKWFAESKWFDCVELCTFAEEKIHATRFASFYVI